MQSIISQPTGSDPETGSGRFQTGRRNLKTGRGLLFSTLKSLLA